MVAPERRKSGVLSGLGLSDAVCRRPEPEPVLWFAVVVL